MNISTSFINSENTQYTSAMTIIQELRDNGYSGYFVGGCVRDFIAGKENDDIDIVTDAPVKTLKKLFPKSIDTGIDYGVLFVKVGDQIFEVATFRKDGKYTNGRSPNSVSTGSMVDDAKRRDFTVNALYYDPLLGNVFDHTGGLSDIDSRVIRSIGDPLIRLEEDQLRVLRAIRFSTKLEFEIEDDTLDAIKSLAPKLFPSLSKQKVWKELKKMSHYPNFGNGILLMHETGVLKEIFPTLKNASEDEILDSIENVQSLPIEAPTIVKILQLFPCASESEAIKLCKDLKLSRREGSQVIKDYYYVKNLLDRPKEATDYDWVVGYAKHNATLFVPRGQKHDLRKTRLSDHIQRMKSGTSVLKASDLQSNGLDPKVLKIKFKKLLDEASKISVNKNLSEPEDVLRELKKSTLWPTD